MSFNPLKEKGLPLDKQLRNWEDMVGKPYNKIEVDCYHQLCSVLLTRVVKN